MTQLLETDTAQPIPLGPGPGGGFGGGVSAPSGPVARPGLGLPGGANNIVPFPGRGPSGFRPPPVAPGGGVYVPRPASPVRPQQPFIPKDPLPAIDFPKFDSPEPVRLPLPPLQIPDWLRGLFGLESEPPGYTPADRPPAPPFTGGQSPQVRYRAVFRGIYVDPSRGETGDFSVTACGPISRVWVQGGALWVRSRGAFRDVCSFLTEDVDEQVTHVFPLSGFRFVNPWSRTDGQPDTGGDPPPEEGAPPRPGWQPFYSPVGLSAPAPVAPPIAPPASPDPTEPTEPTEPLQPGYYPNPEEPDSPKIVPYIPEAPEPDPTESPDPTEPPESPPEPEPPDDPKSPGPGEEPDPVLPALPPLQEPEEPRTYPQTPPETDPEPPPLPEPPPEPEPPIEPDRPPVEEPEQDKPPVLPPIVIPGTGEPSQPDPDVRPEPEPPTKPGPEPEPKTPPETPGTPDRPTEPDTRPRPNPEPRPGTDPEPDTRPRPNPEPRPRPETDPRPRPGPEPDTRPEPEPRPRPGPGTEPEPGTEDEPRLPPPPTPPPTNPDTPTDDGDDSDMDICNSPCITEILDRLKDLQEKVQPPEPPECPPCPEFEEIKLAYGYCEELQDGTHKPLISETPFIVLKDSVDSSTITQFAFSAELAKAGCECKDKKDGEPILAIPEWWQVRPGSQRPQAIVIFREKLNDGTWGKTPYPFTIPWYDEKKGRKPNFPAFTKGQIQGLSTLSDNSKLIIYAQTRTEAERQISLALNYVQRAYSANAQIYIGERKGAKLKTPKVHPYKISFFSTGQAQGMPDWEEWY